MATSRKSIVKKTRMVEETYNEVTGVVLELDTKEAELLAALLGFHVNGGNPVIMDVYKALKNQTNVYGPGVSNFRMKMTGIVTVD